MVKGVPIPLILDLWSLGHSAADIARRCKLPNHRHIERIIAHAREIRDPRAVWHMEETRRLMGKGIPRRDRIAAFDQHSYRGFEIVPRILPVPAPPKLVCRNGHELAGENINARGKCFICKRAAWHRWKQKQ
jgi:hypothetical protein